MRDSTLPINHSQKDPSFFRISILVILEPCGLCLLILFSVPPPWLCSLTVGPNEPLIVQGDTVLVCITHRVPDQFKSQVSLDV